MWFKNPKYCGFCGGLLKTYLRQPSGSAYTGETWKMLECPQFRKSVDPHYSKILKRWKTPPNFDPYTGEKLDT